MSNWHPIESAPRDGTEILVRNEYGFVAIAAWSDAVETTEEWFWNGDEGPGWYRRAEGKWDLYDNYMPQEVEAVEWTAIPAY